MHRAYLIETGFYSEMSLNILGGLPFTIHAYMRD